MNRLTHIAVWLSRIHRCRGFGIQSPKDYAFVRYVVNEHWPYYAYSRLDTLSDDWLTRRLGRLYFRLANWRQPARMAPDSWQPYWQAGCAATRFDGDPDVVELARADIADTARLDQLLAHSNQQSVIVVERIGHDRQAWQRLTGDPRTGTTFDLYYCGIVFTDTQRYRHHYVVNF